MKEILKKNITLISILVISFLFFVVLVFFAYMEWTKVKTYQANLIELREKIKKLNESRPYPVKENLVNINNDIQNITTRLYQINRFFGKPYENALKAFLKVFLSENQNEENFINSARNYIRNNYKRTELPEKLLMDFLAQKYSEEDIKKAKLAFIEEAKSKSVEPINESNVNGMILEAIGFNRTLSPDACKVYMQNMEISLLDFAKSTKTGTSVVIDEKGASFRVYDDADKLPPVDFIPHIIKHYKLLDDLLFRIKSAGIDSVKTIQKLNGLEGTRDGQYLIFKYKLGFSGTSQSVRNFIQNLQKAHEDYRIYIIRSLSMKKTIDEVKSKMETNKSDAKTAGAPKEPAPTVAVQPVSGAATMVIGINDKIDAEMVLDYIIFVGDEIKLR